jgi:hypothetical protein
MMLRAAFAGFLSVGTIVAASQPAHAYWTRWGWREPVVVLPRPVPIYGPPPVYLGPRPAFWVRPHYDRWGHFIPGHWR